MIVHNENDEARIGDRVLIESVGQKLSAHKTFTIKEIIKKMSLEDEFSRHLYGVESVRDAKKAIKAAGL